MNVQKSFCVIYQHWDVTSFFLFCPFWCQVFSPFLFVQKLLSKQMILLVLFVPVKARTAWVVFDSGKISHTRWYPQFEGQSISTFVFPALEVHFIVELFLLSVEKWKKIVVSIGQPRATFTFSRFLRADGFYCLNTVKMWFTLSSLYFSFSGQWCRYFVHKTSFSKQQQTFHRIKTEAKKGKCHWNGFFFSLSTSARSLNFLSASNCPANFYIFFGKKISVACTKIHS